MNSKAIYFLLFVLSFCSVWGQEKGHLNDCIKKTNSYWGKGCNSHPKSYSVEVTNTCNVDLDVVCAIQETSGEWKVFKKNSMKPGDTLISEACEGNGKFQYFLKSASDPTVLPGYPDLNKEFLIEKEARAKEKGPEGLFDLFAKLLYGEKKNPLANQKVELRNQEGQPLQSSVTDQYGDFVFHKVPQGLKYEIYVGDVNLPGDEKLFLAEQTGSILSQLIKVKGREYKYSLLPMDISKLSKIEIEDPILKIDQFKKSGEKSLVVSQEIFYSSGSDKPSDFKGLEKILEIVLKNEELSVMVVSHTDSKGNDDFNLKLSERRAKFVVDYFISKGVKASRIKGNGEGERKILNRCSNGVDCSETEHQMNRRTEFLFSKSQ